MPMSSQLKNDKRISEHFNISPTDFYYWNGSFKRLFFKTDREGTEIEDCLNLYEWLKYDAPSHLERDIRGKKHIPKKRDSLSLIQPIWALLFLAYGSPFPPRSKTWENSKTVRMRESLK